MPDLSIIVAVLVVSAFIYVLLKPKSQDKAKHKERPSGPEPAYSSVTKRPSDQTVSILRSESDDLEDARLSYLDGQGPDDQIVSIIEDLSDPLIIERTFNNVFAYANNKESLIKHMMSSRGYSRVGAMKALIDQRRQDADRC